MTSGAHIIEKQRISLEVSGRENSLALQQRFLEILDSQVFPQLAQLFDRIAGPDTWIELDKLEIDAGYLSPDEPDHVWATKLIGAYTLTLEQELQHTQTQRLDPATQAFRSLEYYLTQGVLPWQISRPALDRLLAMPHAGTVARLPGLLANPVARRRWVRQWDDGSLQLYWNNLAAQNPVFPTLEALPLSIAELIELCDFAGPRYLRNLYWESLWQAAATPASLPRQWLRRLLETAAATAKQPEQLLQALIRAGQRGLFVSLSAPARESWVAAIETVLREKLRDAGPAARRRLSAAMREQLQTLPAPVRAEITRLQTLVAPGTSPAAQEAAQALTPVAPAAPTPDATANEQAHKARPTARAPESCFVPLAGIVLLHPFVPALFDRAGFLHEGVFRNESAQERALHLLYHVATGLQAPAEEELPLLKLLCGMAFETPVERELPLSEAEQNLAIEMIQAIGAHWQPVQGMAPGELRASFFIRDGKLQRGNMGWNLSVEQMAWDILLAQLPWGLGPIRYDWMKEMVWVEWG